MTREKHMVNLETEGHYAASLDGRPDEVYDAPFQDLVRQVLARVGEDPGREGLRRTPLRVAKALDFLTSGYGMTVDEVVRDALFSADAKEMVVVRDIEFYSLCEHHLLPFFGRAHVAYLPNGQVIGLSKIARVVDVFARRLQVQERLTNQIADALLKTLQAQGGDGGQSHLHDDAGRAEAEQQHRHERDARKLRDQRTHAQ